MHVKIKVEFSQEGAPDYAMEQEVTDAALAAVRLSFNPSGKAEVELAKALAAAAISQMDNVKGREASIAKTQFEQGAMWAVKALTA